MVRRRLARLKARRTVLFASRGVGLRLEMKILIVDDDRTSCSILSGRLNAAGHQTLTAFDAMSGFTSIMRERPDLVILDLGMPAGGGFSVAQRMRAIPTVARTPIIIVTASDDEPTRERARSIGATAFVPKPLDMELVLRAVDDTANASSGNPPA